MSQIKPWLDKDGRKISSQELSEIAKSWDIKTWESYLNSLEGYQSDVLLSKGMPDISNDEYVLLYKNLLHQEAYPNVKKVINAALCTLTPREQAVIRGVYWNGLSIQEIAKTLGISRTTASSYKSRACEKLANLLLSGAVERGIAFLSDDSATTRM